MIMAALFLKFLCFFVALPISAFVNSDRSPTTTLRCDLMFLLASFCFFKILQILGVWSIYFSKFCFGFLAVCWHFGSYFCNCAVCSYTFRWVQLRCTCWRFTLSETCGRLLLFKSCPAFSTRSTWKCDLVMQIACGSTNCVSLKTFYNIFHSGRLVV